MIFTPDSGHAYSCVSQAVCKNLSVKGFKGLEISPPLCRHNGGQVSLWSALLKQFTRVWVWEKPDRLMVMPCGGWIEQNTSVCLSHWHLLLRTQWLGTHCYGSVAGGIDQKVRMFKCNSHFILKPFSLGFVLFSICLKGPWMRAILVVLIRLRIWTIVGFN